ncbi:MAG: ABC transporter ATP-binding protein [Proteobacteria bacterium]|nr:ABC transporter ATP-binding protein [Pseudomonadota bacterium]
MPPAPVSDQADAVLLAAALRKHYFASAGLPELLRGRWRGRRIAALQGVDLEVHRGEIVGLLGPNGAGKSTLLKLAAGLLLPDEGVLELLGRPVARLGAALRRQVSYVSADERSFSWRISGQQNLEFFAVLHGLRGAAARTRVRSALARVELEGDADRAVREYSSGTRQRLAFARALLGDPELFLFDEPTRGVDPRRASELRRFVRERLLQGRTAVVATHDLTEVRELCTRVVMIEQGRIVGGGAPEEAPRLLGVGSGAGGVDP